MTNKSEWQEANRRLQAEEREKLGDPPTAEEMLAYSRGELPEGEEERIRELLVAYPELARMYGATFPDGPRAGDADAVPDSELLAAWNTLQRRLGGKVISDEERKRRADAQRGRARLPHYLPATFAAALALVFFGLFVQAESRARYLEREGNVPRVLGAPQELDPDSNRGAGTPTLLQKDGEAYLLKLRLINQVRYPHYSIELHGKRGPIWTSHVAQPDGSDAFQLVIPHDFLRTGERYQLRVFGVDGQTRSPLGAYDVAVRSE